jgi:surface protein
VDRLDAGSYCPGESISPWEFCHNEGVTIGRSANFQIQTIVPIEQAAYVRFECPKKVDKSNWLYYEQANDKFDVMTSNENWTITTIRTDANTGWNLRLLIKCKVYVSRIRTCPVCMSCDGFNDYNIRDAAKDWVSNQTSANSTHGLIDTWDVSKVTSLENVWCGWDESSCGPAYVKMQSFNGDISMWDVSKVTTLRWTFKNAQTFNGDISEWDVSNVVSMKETFMNSNAFNRDISKWDVSNVDDMYDSKSICTLGNDLMCCQHAIVIRWLTGGFG